MFCRNCGNELRDGAPFCGYCGTRVERKIACKNCGALVEDKFAFCLNCGTPLDKDSVAPAQAQVEQEAVENVAAPVVQEPDVEVETPVVQAVEQTDMPENKKRVKIFS